MAKKKQTTIKNWLPEDVAEKFEVKNWKGGHRQDFGLFGVVDLINLTIPKAERLVKRGFSKLVIKKGQPK